MGAAIDSDVGLDEGGRSTLDAVCSHCTTVLYRRDALCPECGGRRPSDGWRDLDSVHDEWLGEIVLDHLLVMRQVGIGSTATVYHAQSLRTHHRFALKIIDLDRPGSSHEENLANARREVEIASRLRNPHIVRIYEMREISERHVGVVMDLVEGEDLRSLINREGPMQPPQAIELIRQVGNGLHEAHQAGIVHRDVKPENLLVHTRPNGTHFVQISDFGIASPAAALDRDQGFIGTPLWASPEQIMGERVDGRSDIYSMGALLYYLLTGSAPFNHGNYMKILRSHLNVEAPQLRDAAGRLFSAELEEFVATLLSKRREARPSDLLELLAMIDDLERVPQWASFVDVDSAPVGLMEDSETIERPIVVPEPRGLCMEDVELSVASDESQLAVLRDGRVAFVGQSLKILTLSPRVEFVLTTDTQDVQAVELTDRSVLVGDGSGRVRRLRLSDDDRLVYHSPDGRAIVDIAADPGEHVVAIGTRGGLLHLRYAGSSLSHTQRGGPITALAVDRHAQRLAIARRNGAVEVRDSRVPDDVESRIDVDRVESMAISADGHMLGVLQTDGTVSVWAIDTATRVFKTRRSQGHVTSLQFAAEGLLGLCRDGEECYVVDLQCAEGGICTPDCPHCLPDA